MPGGAGVGAWGGHGRATALGELRLAGNRGLAAPPIHITYGGVAAVFDYLRRTADAGRLVGCGVAHGLGRGLVSSGMPGAGRGTGDWRGRASRTGARDVGD